MVIKPCSQTWPHRIGHQQRARGFLPQPRPGDSSLGGGDGPALTVHMDALRPRDGPLPLLLQADRCLAGSQVGPGQGSGPGLAASHLTHLHHRPRQSPGPDESLLLRTAPGPRGREDLALAVPVWSTRGPHSWATPGSGGSSGRSVGQRGQNLRKARNLRFPGTSRWQASPWSMLPLPLVQGAAGPGGRTSCCVLALGPPARSSPDPHFQARSQGGQEQDPAQRAGSQSLSSWSPRTPSPRRPRAPAWEQAVAASVQCQRIIGQ